MPSKPAPLLCELHAHTTWSDGELSVRELCDLYGRHGFDVLAVTDHTVRAGVGQVNAGNYDDYLREIELEAERARARYDLLVIPGLELTYDDPDPMLAGHAVAIGLRGFVDVELGLEPALAAARELGAALVAAHPYSPDQAAGTTRGTAAFAGRPDELAPLVDRFELFNRAHAVRLGRGRRAARRGERRLPPARAPARPGRRCCRARRTSRSVVAYLRSRRPAYLVRLEPSELRLAA